MYKRQAVAGPTPSRTGDKGSIFQDLAYTVTVAHSFKPVSYTHLDGSPKKAVGVFQEFARGVKEAADTGDAAWDPVSFTHLDVYKRQVLDRGLFCKFSPAGQLLLFV